MLASRIDALLDVWERTLAPLRECRSVLESVSWDVQRAREVMDSREPSPPPRPPGDRAPSKLLSTYKELARTHRDAPRTSREREKGSGRAGV
jgi:hypothetical protein